MKPEEMAEKLYRDAYNRWCYELSHEKNVATAKDIAMYMCDLVGREIGFSPNDAWWYEVKECVKTLKH